MPADDVVQQCGVEDGAGDRADLVQRGRQGDRAVAAHPAVGRLDPDGARDGTGLADRATGVGAERERRFEGGDRGGGTATGPAGDPAEVPRVVRRAVRRELGRRAHRELVHVRLAERHHAGAPELEDRGGVVRRHPALEDLRPGGRGHVDRAEDVLDGDRHPGERAEVVPGGAARVDRLRDAERVLVDVQERVHVGVDGGDAVEVGLGGLDARHVARHQGIGERGGAQAGDVVGHCSSPRIAVTRNRSPSESGAPERACSCVSVSPTTSGRRTFGSATG